MYNLAIPRLYKLLSLLIFLSLPAIACGGIGLVYEDDLIGEYAIWGVDSVSQAALVEKTPNSSGASDVVGAMIYEYGWNDTFIILKQHPNLNGFSNVDTHTTNWFIVEVNNGLVHGPLTESEFHQRFDDLSIPNEVQFSDSITPRP